MLKMRRNKKMIMTMKMIKRIKNQRKKMNLIMDVQSRRMHKNYYLPHTLANKKIPRKILGMIRMTLKTILVSNQVRRRLFPPMVMDHKSLLFNMMKNQLKSMISNVMLQPRSSKQLMLTIYGMMQSKILISLSCQTSSN